MATTRRRASGFDKPPESEPVLSVVDEDAMNDEQTEMKEEVETVIITPLPVIAESAPFVEETIVPTEDFGPRFLEVTEPETPAPKKATPEAKLMPGPKRHPRNVPRFSRSR